MGIDHLEALRQSGKGIIVANSHVGFSRFVPLSLIRLGYDLHSIEAADVLRLIGAEGVDRLHVMEVGAGTSFLLRQTYESRKILKDGGMLHILPDGLSGGSGATVQFHGRLRPFTTSFAQLAVATGAEVIPVIASMDVRGRIQIEFSTPFDTGSEKMAQRERVDSLITQYARFLEAKWSDDPGSVRMPFLQHFLSLPSHTATVAGCVSYNG